MTEIDKIVKELMEKFNIRLSYYAENAPAANVPVCDWQFDKVTDDGSHTFFRFLYRNVGYIGVLDGCGETERNYALLLPSYIEGFAEKVSELPKTEQLKRILMGEYSSMGIYKYVTKYSVKNTPCFAIVLRVPKLMGEAISALEQYGGNSLDTVVQISDDICVLVRFEEETAEESNSAVEYAEFLTQSLKEELGVDAQAGVGPTVRELKDIAVSYASAENALRYADVFQIQGNVHFYRDFILMKMLEDVPESRLREYLSEISDERFKEVFEDEEMLATAEAFLQCNLNVSETSRRLYLHRNTLLYRLDKIEKATGLNIRLFSAAVSFRVLTVLYKLLKK